jgi:hypothetical protein
MQFCDACFFDTLPPTFRQAVTLAAILFFCFHAALLLMLFLFFLTLTAATVPASRHSMAAGIVFFVFFAAGFPCFGRKSRSRQIAKCKLEFTKWGSSFLLPIVAVDLEMYGLTV